MDLSGRPAAYFRCSRVPAFAFLLLLSSASAHAENATIVHAIDGFVRPAYAGFRQSTEALATDVDALCASPGDIALETVREAFTAAVRSWSHVENIRFGPVTEENRLERILFWPDRKGIGLKQVQAAIAGEDATAADPQTLPGKSVAMQGLGALEFVLSGSGSDSLTSAAGAYRCRYGLAIATNLDTMATAIAAAWDRPDGVAQQWANPGAANPLYRTDAEAMTELFNVFVHGLEMVRDVRINGFLGKTPDGDKPKSAIFWRSGATLASINGDLAGLSALFNASKLSAELEEGDYWIAQSIRFEFSNADFALQAADGPIDQVLGDGAKRKKLDYARIVTSSLSELFGVKLAAALDLSAGFSSLDGD